MRARRRLEHAAGTALGQRQHIQKRLAGNGRLPGLLAKKLDDRQLIEQLYLWSLCRRPSDHELAVSISFFQTYGVKKRTEAAQDLMWALLNSKDFLLLN